MGSSDTLVAGLQLRQGPRMISLPLNMGLLHTRRLQHSSTTAALLRHGFCAATTTATCMSLLAIKKLHPGMWLS